MINIWSIYWHEKQYIIYMAYIGIMLQRHISSVVHNYNVQFGRTANYSVLHHCAVSPHSWNAWWDEWHNPAGCERRIHFHLLFLMAVLNICSVLRDSCCNKSGRRHFQSWHLEFKAIEWFLIFFLKEIPFQTQKDSTKTLSSCLHSTRGVVVVILGIKDIK